tara:strand:- start:1056 stop:1475 length:420 start_codon:yes stop_codon:yes gene_type:complete
VSRVVFTNGCFDILHRGHVELLRYCKRLGRVVVGLNSDQSVKRLKGETRPINSQADRAFLLKSLRFVDEVLIFEEDTPYEAIKKVKPDLLIKGGDYDEDVKDPLSEKYIVGADLCEVKVFNRIEGYSTSASARRKNFHE